MADKTVRVFDQSANTYIETKYVDSGDGSYARTLVDVGSVAGLQTNGVNVFDQSANANIAVKYYITGDGSQARSLVGA